MAHQVLRPVPKLNPAMEAILLAIHKNPAFTLEGVEGDDCCLFSSNGEEE